MNIDINKIKTECPKAYEKFRNEIEEHTDYFEIEEEGVTYTILRQIDIVGTDAIS